VRRRSKWTSKPARRRARAVASHKRLPTSSAKAATTAGMGQPWMSSVRTSVSVASGWCSRSSGVLVVAANVRVHVRQR